MTATFDHEDIEEWLYFTCYDPDDDEPVIALKGKYPTVDEGDNMAIAVENAFISETGLAVDTSDAQHIQLCRWIAELEFRKWNTMRHGVATARSTPGGSVSYGNTPLSFSWDAYYALVNVIKHSDDSQVDLVDGNHSDGDTLDQWDMTG